MLVEKIDPKEKRIVFVYTTCPSLDQARSMGLSAINEKLAACVDYWSIGSIYPWNGVIQDVEQYMLMLTTERNVSEKLVKYIGGLHPYSTPMIARMDTAYINQTYSFWVDNIFNTKGEYISELQAEEEAISEAEDGYHFGKLK